MSVEEWKSALTLAKKWEFSDVQKQAIEGLSKTNFIMEAKDRMLLGQKFEHALWIVEGIRALVSQEEVVTPEEMVVLAEALGWETTAKLLRLRAQYAKNQSTSRHQNCGCAYRCSSPANPPQISDSAIQAEFSEEFSHLGETDVILRRRSRARQKG